MDKLLTNINGRMPFVLNDLRFVDQIYRDTFAAMTKTLGLNNLKLHGCQLTDNEDGTFTVAAGAVVIGHEIYLCTSHTFACTNIAQAWLQVATTYDAEGLKAFGDGSVHNVYQLNRVVGVQSDGQPANSVAANSAAFSYYNKAQADLAISNAISSALDSLIAGAPGALDTLNELASAMGNDPNFSATVINSLAGKVDKITGYGLSKNDFTDALQAKLNAINADNLAYLSTPGAWQSPNEVSGIDAFDCKYRLVLPKLVEIRGEVLTTTYTANGLGEVLLFNLPEAYRPVNGLPIVLLSCDTNLDKNLNVRVKSNGEVMLMAYDTTTISKVVFSHMFSLG